MKVMITGGNSGQLKWELLRCVPDGVQLVGSPANAESPRLDITDAAAVMSAVAQAAPDCIINAAAYTAVDKAETESEQAWLVNDTAVANLCHAALEAESRLIHVSTDFVFGLGNGSPFESSAATNPNSVYGESKLAGEKHVNELMAERGVVIRTAWVYSSYGQNFVKTMLRLMKERDEVGVVADQIGSPTWAAALAGAVWRAADTDCHGILHWTGAGAASWYDFAQAIYEEGLALGLLNKPVLVKALRTDQFPLPAMRPAYSVLETTRSSEQLALTPQHWRVDLRKMLSELE